jgi:hypothetical protein
MAAEFRNFEVSVPAGTAKAAAITTDLTMPARVVRHIRIRIPPGPSGLVGFALAAAGVSIIPWNAGAWYVGDDEVIDLDPENQITSGAWQLRAYNLGANAHTLYLAFSLDPVQSVQVSSGLSPLTITQQ